MAEANKGDDARRVTLKNVRLSYPTLVTAEATIEGGPKKFSANFLLDPNTPDGKANVEAAKRAVAAAETAEFKETGIIKKAVEDPKRIALRAGERFKNTDGEVYSGYEGMVGVAAKAQKRPKLWNRKKELVAVDDIDELFYGGVYVDAVVSFYCTSKKEQGGKGLFCTVEGIRSREQGEAFGGGARASEDDFDDLEDDDDGFEDKKPAAVDDDLDL